MSTVTCLNEPWSKTAPCRPSTQIRQTGSFPPYCRAVEPVRFLSDRRYHRIMETCWADGLAAHAPIEADACEWRDSARRLARRLGTTVRTGHKAGRVFAVANGGYPLGLSDPYERDEWLRRHADA